MKCSMCNNQVQDPIEQEFLEKTGMCLTCDNAYSEKLEADLGREWNIFDVARDEARI